MRQFLRYTVISLLMLSWLRGEELPPPLHLLNARFGHIAAIAGENIYVIAGCDDKEILGSIERITADRSHVEPVETTLTPRYWLGGASDGKNIYLAGGIGVNGITNLFECWSPGEKKARTLSPMPEARDRFDLVLVKSKSHRQAVPGRSRPNFKTVPVKDKL
ncbi:MAG: hypothetical protein RIQ79_2456, partial [Verrucomicrobiota bacterium]